MQAGPAPPSRRAPQVAHPAAPSATGNLPFRESNHAAVRRGPGVRRQALHSGRRLEHDRARPGAIRRGAEDRRRLARGRDLTSLGALPRGRRRPTRANGDGRGLPAGRGTGGVHSESAARDPRGLAHRCGARRQPRPAPAGSRYPLRLATHDRRRGATRRVARLHHAAASPASRRVTVYDRPFGRYLEDFVPGDIYRHWPGKTITEADDHLFCMITMNHHPLHTNAWFAEHETVQGKNVVVGNLVYSLALGMSVPDVSGSCIANLEVESLLHRSPTFHGDTIYAETRVLDATPSKSKDDRG